MIGSERTDPGRTERGTTLPLGVPRLVQDSKQGPHEAVAMTLVMMTWQVDSTRFSRAW